MRYLLLYLLLINTPVFAVDISLSEVRILYQKSAFEEASCKKLIYLIQNNTQPNNHTLVAYKACATMMMAKYIFNPFKKLSTFYKGKKMLENSLGSSKDNIEITFLRFTVQSNSPSFLGYQSSIINDKIYLLNSIDNLKDSQLKEIIINYLKTSDRLSLTEKKYLRS